MSAAAHARHLAAVGVILNAAGLYSTANPFDGLVPAMTDMLVRTTVYSSAKLDGVVGAADYMRTDAVYGTATAG